MAELFFPYPQGHDHLAEAHAEEFHRLNRAIGAGQGFRLLFAQFNQHYYRDNLCERLLGLHEHSHWFRVEHAAPTDFAGLLEQLRELAAAYRVVHVTGLENWRPAPQQDWLHRFNYQRETLAKRCPLSLLLWLPPAVITQFALQAPDLWAWRAGVFDFVVQAETPLTPRASTPPENENEQARRRKRVAQIQDYLQDNPQADPPLRASLLREQGELLVALDEFENARSSLNHALALYRELEDEFGFAEVLSDWADLDSAQGAPDKALQSLREEILPLYERLGDVRLIAVSQGQIADILQARGELDEALRIREEEQLPVFERLGDVRELLITRWKIALQLMQLDPPQPQKAQQLLCLALAEAERMGIPEAERIRELLAEFGMECG